MNASDLREVFETLLPEEALHAAVAAAGLQERQRKLDAQRLLRAMVIAAATGYGGRQADVMRLYFELGAPRVVRGGFYAWFGRPLEAVMEDIRDRALAYAAAQPRDLPGWLGEHVRDWHIVDSSTVKLDDRLISERLIAIRQAAPQATLIVDANESWHSEGLAARCQLLADLGVAMLEQPLPADADAALENFVHPLPICADESCHTRESLPRLRGRYEMVNIKLDKTGGLTEALALAGEAERQGFERMLGCMLCTSRGIAAALPLAPLARFADLDGPTWLAVDVEPALRFSTGVLHL